MFVIAMSIYVIGGMAMSYISITIYRITDICYWTYIDLSMKVTIELQ